MFIYLQCTSLYICRKYTETLAYKCEYNNINNNLY